jgi:aminoglycoside phosphotransferase (APT) family kinase protein
MDYRHDPVHRTVMWLRDGRSPAPPTGFAAAFAAAWAEWARLCPRDVAVRIGLTNYKPFERARVMADVTLVPGRPGSSPVTLNLFLHVFAEPGAARREFEAHAGRGGTLGGYGPPVLLLEDWNLVAWTLPNAPNLRELHELLDPAGFRRMLACRAPGLLPAAGDADARGPTLVRYVPLKRALLVWDGAADGRRRYVKLIDGPAAAAAALNLREIHAWAAHGALGFAVPRPERYSPELRTMVMSEVPGRRFTAVMAACRPGPFAEVGRALAGLHRLPTRPITVWSPERELADLRRHMAGVRRALPGFGGRLDAVLDRLARPPALPERARVPIHGNLFGDQILYDGRAPAGQRVGIVDWDAWACGNAHFDLGRLVAHVLYVARIGGLPEAAVAGCVRALLRAYGEAGGVAVQRDTLHWHIAAALLLRAKISSLRPLRRGWPRHFDLMIAEAARVLDGDGAAAAVAPERGVWRSGARATPTEATAP